MLANRGEDSFFGGKSDHTFPNVTHGRHLERIAQDACGSATVGHSHDRCYVEWLLLAQLLKSTQQYWETGATAYSDDPHRPSPLITTPMVLSRTNRTRRNTISLPYSIRSGNC